MLEQCPESPSSKRDCDNWPLEQPPHPGLLQWGAPALNSFPNGCGPQMMYPQVDPFSELCTLQTLCTVLLNENVSMAALRQMQRCSGASLTNDLQLCCFQRPWTLLRLSFRSLEGAALNPYLAHAAVLWRGWLPLVAAAVRGRWRSDGAAAAQAAAQLRSGEIPKLIFTPHLSVGVSMRPGSGPLLRTAPPVPFPMTSPHRVSQPDVLPPADTMHCHCTFSTREHRCGEPMRRPCTEHNFGGQRRMELSPSNCVRLASCGN